MLRFLVKGKKYNDVALNPEACVILEKFIKYGTQYLKNKGIEPRKNTPIFFSRKMKNGIPQKIHRQHVNVVWAKYTDYCNISDTSPHSARRAIASHLLDQDTPIEDVQNLLNHANLATTQIYDIRGKEPSRSGSLKIRYG